MGDRFYQASKAARDRGRQNKGDGITGSVEGIEDFLKNLMFLDDVMRTKVANSGLRGIGAEVAKKARANVKANGSYASGALHDSIRVRKVRKNRIKKQDVSTSYAVRPQRKYGKAFAKYVRYYGLKRSKLSGSIRHGHLVELGHTASNGRFIPGKPFLRPAIESVRGEVEKIFVKVGKRRFDREMKKLRTRR